MIGVKGFHGVDICKNLDGVCFLHRSVIVLSTDNHTCHLDILYAACY